VVHFALEELQKDLEEGQEEKLVTRLRAHVEANLKKKQGKS
jgi:hypothetical protein